MHEEACADVDVTATENVETATSAAAPSAMRSFGNVISTAFLFEKSGQRRKASVLKKNNYGISWDLSRIKGKNG